MRGWSLPEGQEAEGRNPGGAGVGARCRIRPPREALPWPLWVTREGWRALQGLLLAGRCHRGCRGGVQGSLAPPQTRRMGYDPWWARAGPPTPALAARLNLRPAGRRTRPTGRPLPRPRRPLEPAPRGAPHPTDRPVPLP